MNKIKLIYLGFDNKSILDVTKLPIKILFVSDKPPPSEVVVKEASFINIKGMKHSKILELIRRTYLDENYNAIITFKEKYQDLLYELTKDSFINSISRSAIYNSRNKIAFRKILKKAGIDNVPFVGINKVSELSAFKSTVQTSVILKPSMGAGSYMVKLIKPRQVLTDLPNVVFPWMQNGENKFIAEVYIPGEEFSVETITVDGKHKIIGIVKRRRKSETEFVGKGHITPAIITKVLWYRVESLIVKMLDAIELTCGPAHTEIKIFKDEIYIIETQIRTGGAYIWDLITQTTGINIRNEIIAHLLGIPCPRENKITSYAGICLLHSPPGIYQGIDVSTMQAKDIAYYEMRFQKGELMPEIQDSVDRRGFIIVQSDDYDKLNSRLEELDRVTIKLNHDEF